MAALAGSSFHHASVIDHNGNSKVKQFVPSIGSKTPMSSLPLSCFGKDRSAYPTSEFGGTSCRLFLRRPILCFDPPWLPRGVVLYGVLLRISSTIYRHQSPARPM